MEPGADPAGDPGDGTASTALPIAAVLNDGDGLVYTVIAQAAGRLREDGWQVAGAVQAEDSQGSASACEMFLRVLPDGPRVGIAQELGNGAAGCRLDQEALEEAVGLVDRSLCESTQFLMLNKFGSRESEGSGFRATIARAIADGVPVVVGLSEAQRQAFEEFVGGAAVMLPSRLDDVLSWCHQNAP